MAQSSKKLEGPSQHFPQFWRY